MFLDVGYKAIQLWRMLAGVWQQVVKYVLHRYGVPKLAEDAMFCLQLRSTSIPQLMTVAMERQLQTWHPMPGTSLQV
jgi:hypothetical protein